MPRDLADVLHYFLPELDDDSGNATPASPAPSGGQRPGEDPNANPHADSHANPALSASDWPADTPVESPRQSGLSILGVPIGDRDVVRAALVWNLAVEIARLGHRSVVLAPQSETQTPLWPEAGIGPLGTELVFVPARNLDELSSAAVQRSRAAARKNPSGIGVLWVRVPPEWLESTPPAARPIPWWLLLSSPNHRGLSETHDLSARIRKANPGAKVGVTIHGVSTIDEARRAFERLSHVCAASQPEGLESYGLLVDDLDVYRAIAAQRPIGLAHPQAPATRALMDVARLICEDVRNLEDG